MKLERILKPNDEDIMLLTKWRRKVHILWKDNFYATFKGTKAWVKQLNRRGDALYFVIVKGKKIGQIGFQNIDEKHANISIGFVIRGQGKSDGSMTNAVYYLLGYAYGCGFKHIYLSVLKSNILAQRFYKKIGFNKYKSEGKLYIFKYGT